MQRDKWLFFDRELREFMYCDENVYDNYVGSQIKNIKSVINWHRLQTGTHFGDLLELFIVPKEHPPTVALTLKQLRFLVMDREFHHALSRSLRQVKDMFIVGSSVALRMSDLQRMKWTNISTGQSGYYLEVASRKTGVKHGYSCPTTHWNQ